MMQGKYKKIGEILVNAGITQGNVENALKQQSVSGDKLGKILIAQGLLNEKQLGTALAAQRGLRFIELYKAKGDTKVLRNEDRGDYIKNEAIPLRLNSAGNITVAISNLEANTLNWIKKKFGKSKIVISTSADIKNMIARYFREEIISEACDGLWKERPEKSAKYLLPEIIKSNYADIFGLSAIISFFALLFIKPIFILMNMFYFSALIFKTLNFIIGIEKDEENWKSENIDASKLPIYSILIPLFKEKKQTILSLVEAIRNLNYPKAKLDIKLIVEESDPETIAIIKEIKCARIFEIVVVPYSLPQTKPKALNYALQFVRGEFVTIYDAEDRPDKNQLLKAILRFRQNGKDLACVQGKLNYYNRNENLLTKMFAVEYSCWFDFMLPGLQKLGIPIPLGGTSNHLRTDVLKEVLAWDPYNVTEDADLGIRLAALGYKTEVINSTTYEEAPLSITSWIKQRSRWIKGHMQTYIVHTRKENKLLERLGLKATAGFLFFIGAPCLVFLSLPLVIASGAMQYAYGVSYPDWFVTFSAISLISAVTLHMLFALAVIFKHNWLNMLPATLIFPFYWVLHMVASFRAFFQLISRPHHWDKTEHGLTKIE